jgi:GNAT superfamily N-acetyltransferase
MTDIIYQTGNNLDLDAVIDLYVDSTLGERRPVQDRERMARMLKEANLIITAWDGDQLVGIARSLTDWVYVTYLSDLAVRKNYQRQGIGRELIRRTQAACDPKTMLLLLAAPAAEKYYPHIGFEHHPQAWMIRGEN